jgi:hypothetical protein
MNQGQMPHNRNALSGIKRHKYMKAIAISVDYDNRGIILMEDYSFCQVDAKLLFSQLVPQFNNSVCSTVFIHDAQRGGIARIDRVEQAEARIFPTYAEFVRVAEATVLDWINKYFDDTGVTWITDLQETGAQYERLTKKGCELKPYTEVFTEIDFDYIPALELLLAAHNHQRNYIKRRNIPSKYVFARKRKDYTIRCPAMRKLIVVCKERPSTYAV